MCELNLFNNLLGIWDGFVASEEVGLVVMEAEEKWWLFGKIVLFVT